MTESMTLQK